MNKSKSKKRVAADKRQFYPCTLCDGRKVVIVNRSYAERLFAALGCVNTKRWDAYVLVNRLRHIPVFNDAGLELGEFRELMDALESLGKCGLVVLRSTARQRKKPVSVIDRDFSSKCCRRTKSGRKRGEAFSFEKCGIPPGSVLILKKDPSVKCVVVGDTWLVDFGDGVNDESFTSRTRRLLGVMESTWLSPMHYWLYNGRLLRYYYKKYQRGE